MSISKVQTILVGTLSDQRMQAWATVALPNGSSQTFSRWKATTDPNSGWTDWQLLPPDYNTISLAATALSGTLQSQLWAAVGEFGTLQWRLKTTQDSHSEWLPWMDFYPAWPPPGTDIGAAFNIFAAGVLGGQLAPYFSNTPVQLWIAADDGALYTILSSSPENSGDSPDSFYGNFQPWELFEPPPPETVNGIWPLYYGGGDQTVVAPNTVPVWAVGQSGSLYWSQGTMLYNNDGNLSEGPNWGEWQAFIQLPSDLAVSSFASGLLTDGRIQLFASDTDGVLYSIWQDDILTGTWIPEWEPFPQPGGRLILVGTDPNNVLFPNNSFPGNSLAMASLPDQRLQLFAVDAAASVWTTWKSTTNPDAGWELPWTEF